MTLQIIINVGQIIVNVNIYLMVLILSIPITVLFAIFRVRRPSHPF